MKLSRDARERGLVGLRLLARSSRFLAVVTSDNGGLGGGREGEGKRG